MKNKIEWKDKKIIYRKYASLYFIVVVPFDVNELLQLEILHLYCISLNAFFGNVCELDIIFNFDRVNFFFHLI